MLCDMDNCRNRSAIKMVTYISDYEQTPNDPLNVSDWTPVTVAHMCMNCYYNVSISARPSPDTDRDRLMDVLWVQDYCVNGGHDDGCDGCYNRDLIAAQYY